ncbi:hypothetical protein LINPERHAP2_LOCUS40849 [Linum perenne]
MQQEKDRLQRIHHEEKARIEAQIRKAETALRRKEEMELKEQRQQEREAARAAMLKIYCTRVSTDEGGCNSFHRDPIF